MNKWGKKSLRHYQTLDDDLKLLADEVLKVHDCSVLQGYRDKETQDRYFLNGTSSVRYPFSKHNRMPSMAIDLAPYIPGEDPYDMERVLFFAGIVLGIANKLYAEGAMAHKVKWGGTWRYSLDAPFAFDEDRFFDGVHFQLEDI